jgi:hypothetical protein
MKRKALVLTIISALLVSALAGAILVNLGTADPFMPEHLSKITINSDGSVTPETDYISRGENVYTLTSDIIDEYFIEILCSNIVFDGAGHTINVTRNYASPLDLNEVTNVTIRNIEVCSLYISIDLSSCSHCLITGVKTRENVRIIGTFNTLTESNAMVSMWQGSNNLIIKNNITGINIGSNFNTFSQNNILFDPEPVYYSNWIEHANFWDNGSVGNYWRDYSTKYPNALEISNSGICNTPYVIDTDNVDNYPLMYPWGTPEIVLLGMQNATYSGNYLLNFTVSKPAVWIGYSLDGQDIITIAGNSTIGELTNGLHNVTVYAEDTFGNEGASETIIFNIDVPEPFPTTLVVASVITVVIVGIGVLFYFKKRGG